VFALIKNLILLSLFAVGVLVASHFVRIGGRTVNDQVKSTISAVQKGKEQISKKDQDDLKKLLKDF